MLVESGGSCDTDAYLDKHISIAQKCIDIAGNSNCIIDTINEEIKECSADSYKDWKYLDKMLAHLSHIKDDILAL